MLLFVGGYLLLTQLKIIRASGTRQGDIRLLFSAFVMIVFSLLLIVHNLLL